MKAFLLAAGLGTRLRPITDSLPKCMVPVLGRPLLAYWVDLFEKHGISDVLINLHHLPDEIREYVQKYRGPVTFHLVFEPELLGSAGTLYANRSFVENDEAFYILYADNLTDVNLSELREFARRHPAPLTVGLFHAENPSACGIAQIDDRGTIFEFIEKPAEPKGDLASAGMFIARPELFQYVDPDSYPQDLGTHVMPKLVGRMNGVLVGGYLRDIGTIEGLHRAEKEWQARHPGSQAQNV